MRRESYYHASEVRSQWQIKESISCSINIINHDIIVIMFSQILNLKIAFALLLASLLLVGSLGVSHAGMSMNMDGNMSDCPFMPGVSICSMSPIEMIAASQSFLSNITLNQDPFLLLVSVALILTVFPQFFSPPKLSLSHKPIKRKLIVLSSFLEEAFSDGILNPKLF